MPKEFGGCNVKEERERGPSVHPLRQKVLREEERQGPYIWRAGESDTRKIRGMKNHGGGGRKTGSDK